MRNLVMLFLLPVLALAQRGNENWTTPIADVKFSEGKIIYSFSFDEQPGFFRLRPLSFSPDLLVLNTVCGIGYLNSSQRENLFRKLDEYLENWQPGLANNRDKYLLLEYSTLKILWKGNIDEHLSAHNLETLYMLKNDLSIDIASSAILVLKLYDYYSLEH